MNTSDHPGAATSRPGTLIDRYDDRRTRRFLLHEARMSHYLPGWRTQRRRRGLIVTMWIGLALMAVVGVASMFSLLFALAWVPLTVLTLGAWTMLSIVSNRQGDAPRNALDEWELQQRNAARSIGLSVTQALAFVPMALLILSVSVEGDHTAFAYGCGLVLFVALITGATLPTALIAWNRSDVLDDDPGDPGHRAAATEPGEDVPDTDRR